MDQNTAPQLIRAYAKINIGLRVVSRRPDGYHNIETVFHRIDLFDDILLSPSDDILVRSSSKDVPSDERNLCYKAAKLLREHLGCRSGVCMTLTKRIPAGAGLGGGSSDAASVLRYLPQFWSAAVDPAILYALALRLGSDVPYFLGEGSALAGGRGEILEYFRLDVPYSIVVCNPGIHVSTPWAYSHVCPSGVEQGQALREMVVAGMSDPALLQRDVRNDFEEAVFAEFPAVGKLKQRLLRAGAVFALMSGSGSTVYGMFEDSFTAQETARELQMRGMTAFVTGPGFSPPAEYVSSVP